MAKRALLCGCNYPGECVSGAAGPVASLVSEIASSFAGVSLPAAGSHIDLLHPDFMLAGTEAA
jgi:hypothetical protein